MPFVTGANKDHNPPMDGNSLVGIAIFMLFVFILIIGAKLAPNKEPEKSVLATEVKVKIQGNVNELIYADSVSFGECNLLHIYKDNSITTVSLGHSTVKITKIK